ncbi:MerR family transcriptional regulator [Amycolatopsis sp. NPDC059657]|uniref:MerR family transcriptional regulator n=1 Tax=Amycolatopsis sp. NPDC059657 TaxID=3346899 RepID=UPI003670881A
MTVTQDTLGIGELAELTGVSVRTIRFYCDEGILESRRSAGGHRRFDPTAVEQLSLVRRLRRLGLDLTAITAVLLGERSMDEAIAATRAALDVEFEALAWRRASLSAIEQANPAERAARVDLLARVVNGRAAHGAIVAFWRGLILAPVRESLAEKFIVSNAPEPPAAPTPGQVVAYAEMATLVADRSLSERLIARSRVNVEQVRDEEGLWDGLAEAGGAAYPLILAGQKPEPGKALDLFVDAHASARGRRDTPEFRRELLLSVDADRDPRLGRYWRLSQEVTGAAVPVGVLLCWLIDALGESVSACG